jgi:UDP-N-acetylmuramyl pentapeptide phosphotransferase/UDP-N-acetylglucosamine-1-phosphate transferase
LAVFFIVAMINVYNFMDGIDGLAGGLGIISSLFFSLYFLYTGQYEMGVIQLFLMAVLLGFLVWNYPKAKVFMGDVGAYFLGFNFAVLVLYSSQVAPVKVAFIAGMSWLSVLAVDATVTILWRMIKRQRIWEAHREHFFQKLHLSGWQNQQIIWLEFAHAFFVSLLGVKYAFQASVGEQWVILAIAAISFVVKFWWIQTRWKRSLAPYELIKE